MCRLETIILGQPKAGQGLSCPQLDSLLAVVDMPIFNNHSVVEVVGATSNHSINTEESNPSGDLDFESILQVEGFLENNVFEDRENSSSSNDGDRSSLNISANATLVCLIDEHVHLLFLRKNLTLYTFIVKNPHTVSTCSEKMFLNIFSLYL